MVGTLLPTSLLCRRVYSVSNLLNLRRRTLPASHLQTFYFSTTSTKKNEEARESVDLLKKNVQSKLSKLQSNFKIYGYPFAIVYGCLWATTVGSSFAMIYAGMDVTTMTYYMEQVNYMGIDMGYWANKFGNGPTGAVVTSLAIGEFTFPILFYIDIFILVLLKKYGIIGKSVKVESDTEKDGIEKIRERRHSKSVQKSK